MYKYQFSTEIQKKLILWFQQDKRAMPWRETNDPYKIWISEIMLQQTQVATVEDYYNRFLTTFPDINALAKANIHQVMKSWEGLGYYSRARNLHETSQIIVEKYNSRFPNSLDELLTLPGIGRYTAGAILSIAFGIKAPILDGNVIRVITRIFHITDNISRTSTQKILWEIAESILPDSNLRDFNEALMELGATLCTPKSPLCNQCPIQAGCQAKQLNIQEELPVKNPKAPVPHYDIVAGIIWKNQQFLITLRPAKGLLGNLWEFPGGKVKKGESLETALHREINEEVGISIQIQTLLTSVKHAYTHFKITLYIFSCNYLSGDINILPVSAQDYQWIKPSDLDNYAFPSANRKIINKLKMNKLR